jgi:GNAT superfamily N-acetyltransferase
MQHQEHEFDLGRNELLELGDANLVEFIRHTARASSGGTVVEKDGLLLVAGGHANPGPYRNLAIRTTVELPAAEAMSRAAEFFAARSRGHIFWVRDHADHELDLIARDRGFTALEPDGLAQLYQGQCPAPAEPQPGVELVWADDDERRRDFLQVNAEAWGMGDAPVELTRSVLFEPSSLDAPNVAAAIAYIDGAPAGTCMAIVHPDFVVGGYWGATAQWARRRGLHDLTTRAIFNAGFKLGARLAFCQSSPLAAKNLERMGFEQLTRYRRYRVPFSREPIAGS